MMIVWFAPLAASAGESGLVIFHTQCSRCHGEDGRGKAIFSTPSFVGTKLGAAEMEAVISKGRGKMPAFSTRLTPAEIKDVAASLRRGDPDAMAA